MKAIIFDFDGLIFNSETADFQSWQEIYADFGVTLPLPVWQQNVGAVDLFDPYAYLEELVGKRIDRVAVRAKRRVRDDELLAELGIMPGVLDYLAEAGQLGLRVAVASSSRHDWVDRHLARLGLNGRFAAVCCRDDVGDRGKPDPAVYLAAVAAVGVQPREALALEDSRNGMLAAKRAGLFCTVVPNAITASMDFSEADYRLNSLAEMPLSELLAKVGDDKK